MCMILKAEKIIEHGPLHLASRGWGKQCTPGAHSSTDHRGGAGSRRTKPEQVSITLILLWSREFPLGNENQKMTRNCLEFRLPGV